MRRKLIFWSGKFPMHILLDSATTNGFYEIEIERTKKEQKREKIKTLTESAQKDD